MKQITIVIIILLIVKGLEISESEAAIKYFEFNVKYFTAYPDGVRKRVLGVNNQFPGPTIRAKIHDTLVVTVKNQIQTRENTSIHWHGLEQVLTPFQDGPEMVKLKRSLRLPLN